MSLFPAYSADTTKQPAEENSDLLPQIPSLLAAADAAEKEQQSFAGDGLRKFSSFVPAQPEIPEKTKSQKLPQEPVELSSSGGSDSEVRIISSDHDIDNKKKRKKRKKDKHSHHRKRPKSSEIGAKKSKQEDARSWGFLDLSEAKLSATNQEAPFIFDRKRDIENLQFSSFYKRHVANYKFGLKSCLGGSNEISKLIFGDSAGSKKTNRYFARKYQKYRPGERILPRIPARNSELPAHLSEDFIEIQSTWDTGEEKLIYDPSIQMYRPVDSEAKNDEKIDMSESANFQEAELLARSKKFNKALDESPHDVNVWLSFVKFQDKAYGDKTTGQSSLLKGPKDRRMTDLGLLERKMSILDKAVKINPSSILLKLERLKIGREGLWEREKMRDEWRKLEFTHINHLGMWRGYIAFCLEHFSAFSVSKVGAVFDRCLDKLKGVLSGNLVTHQPLPGTEKFVLDCIFWKCQFLKCAGYTERATASLQGLVEFNFFQPEEIKNMNSEEKINFFEPFWDSGKPRFGDFGFSGWKNAVKSAEIQENSQEILEKLGKIEDSVVSEATPEVSDGELWLKLERLRESYGWNPWRSAEEPEDPDRMVLFDDISGILTDFTDFEMKFRLLVGVLEFFGADLLPFESCNEAKRWQEGGKFENLPDLHETLAVDEEERLVRIFDSVEEILTGHEDFREFFACCQLHECAGKMRNLNLPEKEKVRKFKKIAKDIFRSETHRNSVPLYLIFVRELVKFGAKMEAFEIAKTTLAVRCSSLDFDTLTNSKILGILNLLLSFVETKLSLSADSGVLSHCAKVVGNFILTGTFSEVDSENVTGALLIKAKKRITEEILPKIFSEDISEENYLIFGWLGSPVVLMTEISSLFSYCCGNTVQESMRFFEETACALRLLKQKDTGIQGAKSKILDRQLEMLLERKLQLLNLHIKRSNFYSVKFVNEIVDSALLDFPAHFGFLTEFVNVNLKGSLMVKVRRFFDCQTQKTEENNSRTIWLAAVYAEFAKFLNVANSEITDSAELPEIHRIRNVLERATENCADCPIFWRFYLNLESLRGQKERAKQIFYRAVRQCPWSKGIIQKLRDTNWGIISTNNLISMMLIKPRPPNKLKPKIILQIIPEVWIDDGASERL